MGSRITRPRPMSVLAPPYGSRAKVIVRFDLGDHVELLVEVDDAGVSSNTLTHQSLSQAAWKILAVAAKIVSRSMFWKVRSLLSSPRCFVRLGRPSR